MDIVIIYSAFISIVVIFFFYYVNKRLDMQDKYLTNYVSSFNSAYNLPKPKRLDTTEVLNDAPAKVYSPESDEENKLMGKTVDMFE